MITTGLCVLAIVLCFSWWWTSNKKKNAPPGPLAIPLLGHLHLLGELPHKSLCALSRKFGPIMSMKLGMVSTVVASTPEAAKAFLSTHDICFASRPKFSGTKHLFYDSKDMAWASYGPFWRTMRKIAVVELFTAKRLEESRKVREQEISRLLESIVREGNNGEVSIDMNAKLSMMNLNTVSSMALSERFEESSFVGLLQEGLDHMGTFVLGDYFPFLSWLDYQGSIAKMKATHKKLDSALQKVLDKHRSQQNSADHPGDLVDILLSVDEIDDSGRKAMITDILFGGTDTSSITTEWALSELMNNPSCMAKAQKEIDRVVGFDRAVSEDDLCKLNYLRAVVKETFRLHPPLPLSVPHESAQDCVVDGFAIPARTRLSVNVWAIGRDKRWYGDSSEVFDPEMFVGKQIEPKGQDFELIPFGSGRRMCPAVSLGLVMVELTLARLIQAFEWKASDEQLNIRCEGNCLSKLLQSSGETGTLELLKATEHSVCFYLAWQRIWNRP